MLSFCWRSRRRWSPLWDVVCLCLSTVQETPRFSNAAEFIREISANETHLLNLFCAQDLFHAHKCKHLMKKKLLLKNQSSSHLLNFVFKKLFPQSTSMEAIWQHHAFKFPLTATVTPNQAPQNTTGFFSPRTIPLVIDLSQGCSTLIWIVSHFQSQKRCYCESSIDWPTFLVAPIAFSGFSVVVALR